MIKIIVKFDGCQLSHRPVGVTCDSMLGITNIKYDSCGQPFFAFACRECHDKMLVGFTPAWP